MFYYLYKGNINGKSSLDYIKEVFLRHRILNKIILNKDIRFILAY